MSQQLNQSPANSTPALRITRSPSEPPSLPSGAGASAKAPSSVTPPSVTPPPSVPPSGNNTAGGDSIGGYDFAWLILQLERHGKQQFGDHFTIYPNDHDIIRRLLIYFLADGPQATTFGIDLTKGILLTGPVGCGKTCLMSLMKLAPGPERNFTIKPTRDISFEFIQDGYDVILRYSRLSNTHAGPRTYCFDDLGAEQALKYYGNECNVMAEILLSRYDFYIASDMLTHLTTNLSATELEESYGPRVRSRMREMFNLVAFDPQPDKRV